MNRRRTKGRNGKRKTMRKGASKRMRKSHYRGMRRRYSRNKRGGGVDIDLGMLKTKINGHLYLDDKYFIYYDTTSNSFVLGTDTDITPCQISGITFDSSSKSVSVQCLDGTETKIENINDESIEILNECSKEAYM